MNRVSILEQAAEIITKDRAQTHGEDAENSFGKIADMWSAYLEHPVSREDVCAMMVLLKVARFSNNPAHLDGPIDICGYAAIAGELATNAEPPEKQFRK